VLFLDISRQTWNDYKKLPDFIAVTEQAENVIRSQKFGGAAAGLLNANIIARDLGLSDKTELTGKDGGAIETKEIGKNERGSRIALALRKASAKGTGSA
jgi:hypothetical protein